MISKRRSKLTEIIGIRQGMPVLTETQRADLRDRLSRDRQTAARLREALAHRVTEE